MSIIPCKLCKHCEAGYSIQRCFHPNNTSVDIDYYEGTETEFHPLVDLARMEGTPCGPTAKLFEAIEEEIALE